MHDHYSPSFYIRLLLGYLMQEVSLANARPLIAALLRPLEAECTIPKQRQLILEMLSSQVI